MRLVTLSFIMLLVSFSADSATIVGKEAEQIIVGGTILHVEKNANNYQLLLLYDSHVWICRTLLLEDGSVQNICATSTHE